MTKAILIDPFNKVIKEVKYDYGGKYTQITEYIATPEAPHPMFCTVNIDDQNTIYLDDEGLYRDTQAYFKWEGYHQPLQGRGLILGIDYETGESVPPTITIEKVKYSVSFPSNQPRVEPRFEVRSFSDEEFNEFLQSL